MKQFLIMLILGISFSVLAKECPSTKPLVNISIICSDPEGCREEEICESCNFVGPVITMEANCNLCSNREFNKLDEKSDYGLCEIKFSCKKSLKDHQHMRCVSCDYLSPMYVLEKDCSECPNREYKNGQCFLKTCPKGTKRFGKYECAAFDTSLYTHGECSGRMGCYIVSPETQKECSECPNHIWDGKSCKRK